MLPVGGGRWGGADGDVLIVAGAPASSASAMLTAHVCTAARCRIRRQPIMQQHRQIITMEELHQVLQFLIANVLRV